MMDNLMRKRMVKIIMIAVLGVGLMTTGFNHSEAKESTGISNLPDVNFFGVWNAESSTWTVKSKINYSYSENLQPVEEHVKEGDYEGAKEALLTYYQNRTGQTVLPYSDTARDSKIVPIRRDNIFTLGSGEHYLTTFSVNNEASTVDIDVTNQVQNGSLGFFLMARRNDPSTAIFHSTESNSEKPVLEVKVNETVHTFLPTDDTYIRPGSNIDTVFGNDSVLQVSDEGPGAFSDETRKAYLKFDLSDLSGEPSKAVLKLTGKNKSGTGEKEIMLYQIDESSFDEETQTWNNTVQNTFSWEGQADGTNWKTPNGADPEFGWQVTRFYFAEPMAYEYTLTKDETTAKGLIGLMLDFIKDADSYDSPSNLGAGSFPRSLDTAERVSNWINAYHYLGSSESMDATANTAILKTIYKTGQYLQTTDSIGNWGVFEKSALYNISVYFPEFSSGSEWFENANMKLQELLKESVHPDGGYIEATISYARAVVNQYLDIKDFGSANGREFTPDKELESLGHYIMDISLPSGAEPAFGDSGGGSLLPTLKRLGNALNDPTLKYVGSGGKVGKMPSHTSTLYPYDKSAIMRSGWSEQDLYLRLGVDYGPHGHPDENDIIVYGYGRELLPSMGSFTYSDDPKSNWLRNTTEAHNTIEIDDQKQNPDLTGSISSWVSNKYFDFTVGTTTATPGFTHKRAVLFVKPGYWIVSDFIEAPEGTHKYEQNWHLLPTANVAIDPATKTTQSHFKEGANIQVVPADPGQITATVENGYYSPSFYKVSDAKYTSYVKNTAGNATFDTILYPTLDGDTNDVKVTRLEIKPSVQTTMATALDIDLNNGNHGFYYLSHESSLKESVFGEYKFDGKLAYVETTSDQTIKSALIHNGLTLKQAETTLISSPVEVKEIGVKWKDDTVEIVGDNLELNHNKNDAVAIYAPSVDSISVNGENANFTRDGDYIYAVGVKSSGSMKELVKHFEKEGKIKNKAAHSLKLHLTAVYRFEESGSAEKVVKHIKGFKTLLDHQKEKKMISEEAYRALEADADYLIEKWQ